MSWDLELEQASFRGITFGVVAVRDSIGRRFAIHEYPNRNGAEIDDLGREPRPTDIEAVLHGPEYLADLASLMLIADDGKAGTFQHPILGSWTARIERLDIDHRHENRDQVAISISLREDGVGTELPDVFSITAAKDDLEDSAGSVTTSAAGTAWASGSKLATAVTDAGNMIDDVDATLSALVNRFDQLITRLDGAIQEVEEAASDTSTFQTITSLRRCALHGKKLKERIERLQPAVVIYEVAAYASTSIIAQALYGDASRGSDLLRLNRIPNPFAIPPGTSLRVYDR